MRRALETIAQPGCASLLNLSKLSRAAFVASALLSLNATADPFLAPGEPDLRSDLQILADANVMRQPLTVWPVSWNDILAGTENAPATLDSMTLEALERVREEQRFATITDRVLPHVRVGLADDPQLMRTFAATPRQRNEVEVGFSWTGDWLTANISATRVSDAEDEWRLDGSYLGLVVGNWALIAGYPERWWGPGLQASTILSTNARPLRQIGVQRVESRPFSPRWLRWIGPWTLVSFMGELDDDRVVVDALLFGLRVTAKPLPHLEVGLSRTAQWCGDQRPCDLTTFGRLLVGKDNRGVNVDDAAEPGNQLAGFDVRWSLPSRPYALYMQWTAEDSRQGGPQLGSWLRLAGAEYWSALPRSGWQQRTHLEIADTTCQEGGTGFGGEKFFCAYQHGIYRSGYRYEGRSIGHSADADSQAVAVSTLFTGPQGRSWSLTARHIDINDGPVASLPHGISQTPVSYAELEATHTRRVGIGNLRMRLSVARRDDEMTGMAETDANAAIEWLIGY